MARAKRSLDKDEVEELINLKLEELCGRKDKLNANNLYKFSKKIAKNPNYVRNNGSLFNYYGYDFWAGNYKGVDYYGKTRLAEIKNSVDVKVVGKEFKLGLQDIIAAVNKYHNQPEILSKRMCRIFESDKNKIEKLTTKIHELEESNKKLKENLEDFKYGFATLFLNSNSDSNSLDDVLSIPNRLRDNDISNELQNMFKDEYQELLQKKLTTDSENKSNNVTDMPERSKRVERLKRYKSSSKK